MEEHDFLVIHSACYGHDLNMGVVRAVDEQWAIRKFAKFRGIRDIDDFDEREFDVIEMRLLKPGWTLYAEKNAEEKKGEATE